ncbi:uroporphyrinogen-III synthase [Sinobacterium caligoides]|uniref:Uroporphyrinogen-III synthase n=1 Tax=Sinobacterium caligoides TaxID=933926 RepID=A0A3N2DQC8_9GAMM|nr:uroporphyrinogen-III synthase [Sinobacterium caligoides]ROS01990.1 uroporphyrinogen-III synthase [Sinobacterium caligoides]
MTARILITRPSGQSDGLEKALVGNGFSVEAVPTLAIEPITDARLLRPATNAVLALDNYQQVIFISTNAVRYGMALVDQYWPQWPVRIHWHAIGRATALALAAFDIDTASSATASNSEALLNNEELQQMSGQKVLIFRGCGGREHLAEQLRQRGAEVDYAEVYQRRCADENGAQLQSLLTTQLAAAVALSGETLANLLHLAVSKRAFLLTLPLVVPGERVAALAREAGFRDVLIAENASADAVLKTLQQRF